MAVNATILITGANRGIGRTLTEIYLLRPNVTLVAAVRDLDSKTAKTLHDLSRGPGSKLIVVKIDSESETDAKAAVALLKTQHGIVNFDTVIANAGVNFIGTVILFQATLPLLKAYHAKFIVISSFLGSIGAIDQVPIPTTTYGSSKAALNYATCKIHQENPDLIAFAVHPGWIKTELGNAGPNAAGMAEALEDMQETIKALVSLFDSATRDETSGKFWKYDGTSIPW